MTLLRGHPASILNSIGGRIALLLTVGMSAAAFASLLVADSVRMRDEQHAMLDRLVATVSDIRDRLGRHPEEMERKLDELQILGVVGVKTGAEPHVPEDGRMERVLAAQLGTHAEPHVWPASAYLCFRGNESAFSERAAVLPTGSLPRCWLVEFIDPRGRARRIAIIEPQKPFWHNLIVDPVFVIMTVMASGTLSILVARLMTTPLRRLADAARVFSLSVDPEPVPERGPSEVRAALSTFNVMQHRVRDGIRERTQVLAAVAHDLQTPLTRLRLRVEHVSDPALRDRIIADLVAMQSLVRNGLDLARSSESREEWSVVDLDSLLSSIAEDAAETGSDVCFAGKSGLQIRARPNALARCLNNLVENAVKYGYRAEIGCHSSTQSIDLTIRDFGAGISEHEVQKMFEPFVRGNPGRSWGSNGTGIGLTIARAQASTFGGKVSLANHPDGGLVATISIPNRETGTDPRPPGHPSRTRHRPGASKIVP